MENHFLSTDCSCSGFSSPWTCNCGEPANQHITLVETKAERERRGHPTGYATPYKAMGGLTGFSSLAPGYQRLDPSGRGLLRVCFLFLTRKMTNTLKFSERLRLDVFLCCFCDRKANEKRRRRKRILDLVKKMFFKQAKQTHLNNKA